MGRYSRFVAKYPYVLILIDVIIAAVCGPIAVTFYGMPDFSNPAKGFEPRGTSIRGWSQAAGFLREELKDGNLTSLPVQDGSRRRRRSLEDVDEVHACAEDTLRYAVSTPRMIVTANDGSSLFDVDYLKAICDLEDKFLRSKWPDHCDSHSLPLYVSALRNTSCEELSTDDVTAVKNLLQSCAGLYFNGSLQEDCAWDPQCALSVPAECYQYDAVYKILHYLTDIGYTATAGQAQGDHVTHAMVFLRPEWYNYSIDTLADFYLEEMDGADISNDLVQAPAVSFLIVRNAFSAYVFQDLPWYALAMALVIIVLLVYLRSVVLMLAVVLNVSFTIAISYFIYFFICRMAFFPFMNLLSGLLLIAVGADDVFILYDIWRQTELETPEASCEMLVEKTLRHGGLSVFVTSFTTASALLANVVSDITAIRCFGIFAGVSVLVNFLLMITWVPAIIVLIHKATKCCIPENSCKAGKSCIDRMAEASAKFWGEYVPSVILRIWPFWIGLFLLLGVGGIVVVFAVPKLTLPKSERIQVFYYNHPFEVYRRLIDKFRFEIKLETTSAAPLDFHILWGVRGHDNGNHFDPDDKGELEYRNFDIFSHDAQLWMKSFCRALREENFVADQALSVCYMDFLQRVMEGECVVQSVSMGTNVTLTPCCMTSFPVDPSLAQHCVSRIAELTNGRYHHLANNTEVFGEPLFDTPDGELRVFRYVFTSNWTWTSNYDVMDDVHNSFSTFMSRELASAPAGLSEGWFTVVQGRGLNFYDLQNSLARGTFIGIGLSLGMGFVVLLLTSLNILITLYAIFTITLVIAATVGALVLLGWELNVSESLTITLSVGLSIDFTIHYGMAYKLASADNRRERVTQTFASVGSAVAMAALTTFLSGAAIMPGRVLSYQQFGVFLMLIMASSWLFGTFLFLPLCSVIGPLGGQGDIAVLFRKCRGSTPKKDKVSEAPRTVFVHPPNAHDNQWEGTGFYPQDRSFLSKNMWYRNYFQDSIEQGKVFNYPQHNTRDLPFDPYHTQ